MRKNRDTRTNRKEVLEKGSVEKIWHSLGSFDFLKGKSYKVSLQNDDTEGYVVVDALQVIPLN